MVGASREPYRVMCSQLEKELEDTIEMLQVTSLPREHAFAVHLLLLLYYMNRAVHALLCSLRQISNMLYRTQPYGVAPPFRAVWVVGGKG